MNRLARKTFPAAFAMLVMLVSAQASSAHWSNSGSAGSSAATATMPDGVQPTVSASGSTVTVSIPQISVAGDLVGVLGGGYTIKRYPAAGGAAVTPGGSCESSVTGSAPTLTCNETNMPRGDWKYTVSPTLFQWTSAESTASTAITLLPEPPTSLTAAAGPAAAVNLSWTPGGGATGYNVYRRTSVGAYNFSAPLNGATPVTGDSYSDATTTAGSAYSYVIRGVVIASSGQQLESSDSNETDAVTTDGTAPTGVTLSTVATPMRGTVTFSGAASDTGSGVASFDIQYRLSSGGDWSTACSDDASPYSCSADSSGATDGLYDIRALATDGAGNQTASTIQTNRRVDNTGPVVSLTDPGTPLRGTVTLSATSTDVGAGMTSVAFQYKASASTTWTTVSTDSSSPYSANFATATFNGTYDIRALATDVAGNQSDSTISDVVLDNTAPTAIDIQTANGGTLGRPDSGDIVTYTFSEQMLASSILAGWTGESTAVRVRLNQATTDTMTIWNAANTAQLPMGSVRIGTGHVTSSAVLNATMIRTENTILITFGTQVSGTVSTSAANVTMRWTPSTTAKDLAGNSMSSTARTETGAADREF